MKRTLAQIKEKAQTAIELAVFGAILIFVLGSIVQTTLGYNYQQNQTLRAMRLAMLQSFNYSAGLVPNPNGADGTASRNSASVLFIEDRLVAQSGKYAAVDRVPHVFSGGAVHTRNLFMPVEAGEDWNIPIFDVFINGKHFPFSTAALRSRNVAGTPLFTKTPRGVSAWDEGCADCFDLDRDGNIDVPIAQRATFLWQWTPVALNEISLENNRNLLVDLDGDLKEERIVGKNGTVLQYFDSQEGDVDFTINENEDKPPSGVTTDISVFTFTKEGQVLEIDEGKLFGPDRQYVRQAQRSDQIDVVQRIFQLANDTNRFCDASGRPAARVDGLPNPVEACGSCFSSVNIAKTCMNEGNLSLDPPRYPIIFVRSRILNKGGRKWVTDITDDTYIETNPGVAN